MIRYRSIIAIAVGVGLLASVKVIIHRQESEDDPEKVEKRLRAEAQQKLFEECTNTIVGLSRIIRFFIDDYGKSPSLWTADVTAEFVNTRGGIERTNLPFRFKEDYNYKGEPYLICSYDWKKVFDEQTKIDRAKWEAEKKQMEEENKKASELLEKLKSDDEKTSAQENKNRPFIDAETGLPIDSNFIAAAKAAQAAESAHKAKIAENTLKWHQELASKGDAYGEYKMGIRYLSGDGVPVDKMKAKDLLSKSAAQGNKDAEEELSKIP